MQISVYLFLSIRTNEPKRIDSVINAIMYLHLHPTQTTCKRMFPCLFGCIIYFCIVFSNSALGLPNTREQHPFSSIYPRLSVPRRETASPLPSISRRTGGALGDKFNSYQSPLARHQAHVVPEQMLLKCILFRF